MSTRIAGNTAVYFNDHLDKHIANSHLLKGIANKEEAIREQRGLIDILTDYIGFTKHDQVIGALFDIVNPKDSDTLQHGILTMESLVPLANKEAFRNAFSLKKRTDQDENSVVTASLAGYELTEIKFKGELTFCDQLFNYDQDKCAYKLSETPDKLSVLLSNLEYADSIQTSNVAALKDKISALLIGGSNEIYARIQSDIHRALGFLPDESKEGALTKADFLDRIKKIFGGLVEIEGYDISFNCTQEEFTNFYQELPCEDKAFVLIFVLQDFRTPLEGMGAVVRSNRPYDDGSGKKTSSSRNTPANMSQGWQIFDGYAEHYLQIASSNEKVVQITGSARIDFRAAVIGFDGINKREEAVAAHQDVTGTYKVLFGPNREVTDIQFTYSKFHLEVHHKDGSPLVNCPVLSVMPSQKLLKDCETAGWNLDFADCLSGTTESIETGLCFYHMQVRAPVTYSG